MTPDEERHYCERIVRVPGSYLAFEVCYPVPEVAPPPVLRNGWLTFGSFASAHKITDPVVAAWSRILLGAPTARLLLRGRTLDDPSNRVALLARFARCGVAPDRLIAAGRGRAFRLPARLRRGRHRSRHVPVQRRHDHHRGAVAGRSGADVQRRSLGQSHQPVAAAGRGSVGVGRDGRGGLRQPRRRVGAAG